MVTVHCSNFVWILNGKQVYKPCQDRALIHIGLFFAHVQCLHVHCSKSKVKNPFGSSIHVLFSISLSFRQYHPYYVTPGITIFASQSLYNTNACNCDLKMDVTTIHALIRDFFDQMSFIRSSHFRQSTLLFEKNRGFGHTIPPPLKGGRPEICLHNSA